MRRKKPSYPPSDRIGFRLRKLEVFNWGTFDSSKGEVYSVRPDGRTALLVGQNGSGKSTLVDALLTLLVKPGVRNFNVAAGAKKRERDEKTYIRGAYDRTNHDDGEGVRIKYLRPKGDHYSVILACFHNEGTGACFTAALVLHIKGNEDVERVYCLSDGERSIRDDFGAPESTEGFKKAIAGRGFRTTSSFSEFEGWFGRLTHVKPKAMDVFNETVSVKDIRQLNEFIRDHMLESSDWGKKVDGLLGHFNELSAAHQSLVHARRQHELLEPIARLGADYQEAAERLGRAELLAVSFDAWFSSITLALFVPEIELRQQRLKATEARLRGVQTELDETAERCRTLANEIDRAGGERLRQIPLLIRQEQMQADSKRTAFRHYSETLGRIGVEEPVDGERSFLEVQARIPAFRSQLESAIERRLQDREPWLEDRGLTRRRVAELRQELEGLNLRRDNVPQWCVVLRQMLCQELGFSPKDLPFAAELIAVRPDEREWESSIEKVLHGFALSLLVPEKHGRTVSRYLDRTRLAAEGRGRRLVYLHVGEQTEAGEVASPQSLIQKLRFRDGHPFVPWIKGELFRRFHYACCETIEQFQQTRGPVMTRNRHVRSGDRRHEKDDRDEVVDPRNFVLGWDNREKKRHIAAEIVRLESRETDCTRQIDRIEREIAVLNEGLAGLLDAGRLESYREIDFAFHEAEIARLEDEKRKIESDSDVIPALRERLAEGRARETALKGQWKTLTGDEREFSKEMQEAERLIANARADLSRREQEGSLVAHRTAFQELDALAADDPVTVGNLAERRQQLKDGLSKRLDPLRKTRDESAADLVNAMSRFLQQLPGESDLDARAETLPSFLGLRQRIIEDDLPRHERRFKERLNEKVVQEIAFFRSGLDAERRAIQAKIETLNLSLRKLDYDRGRHIQLEAKNVRDPEIAEFQRKLRECIEESFEDSAELNEARFLRIKDLVTRLQEGGNRRWRDKVTDVRRWFDFAAAVIDRQTNEKVSVYQDSDGQSGGEKAKLAFTILVAAVAYQYDLDLDPAQATSDRFHFVVVDEMLARADDRHARYALDLFRQFGLQLLIVAPLDAKARVTQPYIGCYLLADKRDNRSRIYEMSAEAFEEKVAAAEEPEAGRLSPVPK